MFPQVRGRGLEDAGDEQVGLPARLTPPAALADAVALSRLHRRLDRALGGGAALISAGAGYGKTTLLSSWTTSLGDSVDVAWLSLEPRHKDPVLLAEHLRLALAPALELPPAPGVGGIAAALAEGAAGAERPIVVVLDDADRLESAEAFAPFGSLLERSQENFTIVVSGRGDPPLPWPLLRGRGLLVELGAADLAFGAEETRTVLTHKFGLKSSPAQVAELLQATEGWPAGVCLAAISMRDSPDESGESDDWFNFSRHTRELIEAEVLASLPADVVAFLEDTSVVDRLEPEICDHLSGRTDSSDILQGLAKDGRFLEEIPADRPTFRRHAMLSETLRARLRTDRAGREAELLTAASAWYEEHNVLDAAIDLALEAGEVERARKLVLTGSGWALRRGLSETLIGWIESLASADLSDHPELLLALGRAYGLAGDLVGARSALEAASKAVDDRSGAVTPGIMAGIAQLDVSILVWEGRLASSEAAAERLIVSYEKRPEDPVLDTLSLDREAVYAAAAMAALGAGRLEESLEHADAALNVERIIEPTRYTLDAIAVRALAQAWMGEEVLAQRTIAAGRRVRARFESSFGDLYEIAEAWLAASRPPDASWIRAAATGGVAPIQALASLAMAKNCLNRNRAAGAVNWLATAEQALAAVPEPAVLEVLMTAIRAEVEDPGREVRDVPLSRREMEVLEAVAGDTSRAEAGRDLHLSVNTIKTHLRTAYRKLGATSRKEALAEARSRGILPERDALDACGKVPERR